MNAKRNEGTPWVLEAWARALLVRPQGGHLFRRHLRRAQARVEGAAAPRRDGPLVAPADALHVVGGRGARARRLLRLAAAVRRHQNVLLTFVIAVGIVLMIIHWSGSGSGRAAPGTRASSAPASDAARRGEEAPHRESARRAPRPGRAPIAEERPTHGARGPSEP